VETSAGGVVYRRDEDGTIRFLLIRDPYGNWGLPKGHLEEGETPEQAALREVSEESGLTDLRTESELPTIDWYFRDHDQLVHKYCHFFLLESRTGEATPQVEEGISACVWLPLTEAVETITYANAREVLRVAGERLGAAVGADASAGRRAQP
jgi:ADP-ribose pyrophosphatase YjhB (NUDIX family)